MDSWWCSRSNFPTMTQRRFLFGILCVLACASLIAAPQAQSSGGAISHVQTDTVECDQPRLRSESAISVSSTGNRAFAEVETRLKPGKSQGERHCHTQWLLHVALGNASFAV